MIRIPLRDHGPNGSAVGVRVEVGDEGAVWLSLDPEEEGEARVDRTLLPAEARALAAMLLHTASEAER